MFLSESFSNIHPQKIKNIWQCLLTGNLSRIWYFLRKGLGVLTILKVMSLVKFNNILVRPILAYLQSQYKLYLKRNVNTLVLHVNFLQTKLADKPVGTLFDFLFVLFFFSLFLLLFHWLLFHSVSAVAASLRLSSKFVTILNKITICKR